MVKASPAELALELDRVVQALGEAAAYFAGADQADRARNLGVRVAYSPLRTLLEHALAAADRIQADLSHVVTTSTPTAPAVDHHREVADHHDE